MIDPVATGKNIRRMRKERGITVAEIQERLGLSTPRVIYKWQKGERMPGTENLLELSKMFGASVNDIIITK